MKLTRRHALTALSGAVLAGPLSAPFIRPARASAGSVNVYNWSDYIGETTIADFEAETGISVTYDLYASAEEVDAKMLVSGTGYDLVLQSGMSYPRMVAAGVYQKLDRSRLPGWSNLDPDILRIIEDYDPGQVHGVPYMWGSVGMAYNMQMVRARLPDADLNSLDVLFKPENASKLADCGISVLDSPSDAGYMMLKYLGLDPNTAGPAEYAKMTEAFAPIRKYITTFDNANYLNAIPNGELCVINSWSGDYAVAKARAAEAGIEMELAYFVPETGAPAWFDLWGIPADAPNVENAYILLDYLLRPEVAAACTNFTGYANANKAATPLVDPAIVSDPAIYPDDETLSRLFTTRPMTEDQERDLNRAWQTIKSGS